MVHITPVVADGVFMVIVPAPVPDVGIACVANNNAWPVPTAKIPPP